MPKTTKRKQPKTKCPIDRDLPYGLTRDNLPFVQRLDDGTLCHWLVKPTGRWSVDCDTGAEYARLFLPFLRINLGPVMLGWIGIDMIAAGDRNGIVVGFLSTIGDAAAQRGAEAGFRLAADAPIPRLQ